jgi:hypothetical protein
MLEKLREMPALVKWMLLAFLFLLCATSLVMIIPNGADTKRMIPLSLMMAVVPVIVGTIVLFKKKK